MNMHNAPARRRQRRAAARRPRRTPKGRQVDLQALDEIQALLGDRRAAATS